jgi:hypothetical protein
MGCKDLCRQVLRQAAGFAETCANSGALRSGLQERLSSLGQKRFPEVSLCGTQGLPNKHPLDFCRRLVLNAWKNMGIALQCEDARMPELLGNDLHGYTCRHR